MRPVVLDMNGFASFRTEATVDFTGADFFVLAGPTGSGKSTVIDAMTFALYGSVPRWNSRKTVSSALAPTTARGTVKLVFEAGDQRYVAVRELRRMGSSGQVSQRAATLERILTPGGLARPGEPTEVLAKDPGGVTEGVSRLLGLSFDEFCQCVVLPQGRFADFLHAKASDRRDILLRLLGAEHYRQMMTLAKQRASVAGQRAATLDETLAGLADATPAAEETARTAEKALAGLAERVATAVPQIQAAETELAAAEAELARLDRERAALVAVRIPAEAAALDADLASARAALGQARSAESAAQDADVAARQALTEGPQRAELELTRQRRGEQQQCAARLPSARGQAERQAAQSAQAAGAVTEAEMALEELRGQGMEIARTADEAGQLVRTLEAEHAALAAVAVPEGAGELDERVRSAAEALQAARATLDAAEEAERVARAAVESAAGLGALEQAARDLAELRDLGADLAAAEAGLERARAGREAAEAKLASAESARREREHRLGEARRANVAADLRPHLVAGEPCPVCEQKVAALPAPLPAAGIDDAQADLEKAAEAAEAAQLEARDAVTAQTAADSELASLARERARRIGSLTQALAGPLAAANLTAVASFLGSGQPRTGPLTAAIAEVNDHLQTRAELEREARGAGEAVGRARDRVRAADDARAKADADTSSARGALRVARDPLVTLGAPSPGDGSLAAAWAELVSWAAGQAGARAAGLADARQRAKAAAQQLETARAGFRESDARLSGLRQEATAAARAEQEAQTRLAELTQRLAELDQLLQGAPDEAEVTAQLARRDELEAAAGAAEERLLTARSGRAAAEQELAGLERAEALARAQLSATRDPLVALAAPALDGSSLLAAWTALEDWARGAAAERDRQLPAAREAVSTTRSRVGRATTGLSAELAAAGVELDPASVVASAPSAVAGAMARARAATERITERRAQAAKLSANLAAAQEEHRVAKLLGDLLRSDNFPGWLVTSAVDTLVEHASANLAELSAGQFDLTHEGGEFYVIDHADADSRRSVRTLSGGETFQASLALALALSTQMSALAASGAARLDSIFLDEGFGTLDPDSLDMVASTLETLAQGQRMVGVITHVAELAERVPVRFRVSRDTRTSTVVRETLT
jgi:DNA repair protein SbcC/Rad50